MSHVLPEPTRSMFYMTLEKHPDGPETFFYMLDIACERCGETVIKVRSNGQAMEVPLACAVHHDRCRAR